MKPEAQIIAIAEACPKIAHINKALRQAFWNDKADVEFNPLKDLNAMHEVEKVLDIHIKSSASPRYEYSRILYSLVGDDGQPFRAPAAKRAEAFLKTMNLWRDS